MEKTGYKKTSVSLGDRASIVDEIRQKEDRSRSAVIRRAIDYYYMMNYIEEVEAEPGEIAEMEAASKEIAEGKFTTLDELKSRYAVEGKIQQQSRKTTR